jgi:chitin disaccharide deacetylase
VSDAASYLIVNADDYAYYRCVSRGIIDAHLRGIVTATGILANSDGFDPDIALLQGAPGMDLGVHLNVTDGAALSQVMRARLDRSQGRFSGKAAFLRAWLTRQIRTTDVEAEWRAQIERCVNRGLTLSFLNSHEHVHMLPPLFDLAHRLAAHYGIRYVRCSKPEGLGSLRPGALFRDIVLLGLSLRNEHRAPRSAPRLLGIRASGRLTVADIDASLRRMVPGSAYELVCHPGRFDRSEITSPKLLAYHRWEQELAALTSPEIRDALEKMNIRLIGFRDLAALPPIAPSRRRLPWPP